MSVQFLDRSLMLTRGSRVDDGKGGFVLSWGDVGEVRCRVQDANQAERTVSGRQEGTFTHYVWFRRREDVLRGDRLVFSDDTFLEVVTVWREDAPGGLTKCRAWERQKGQ